MNHRCIQGLPEFQHFSKKVTGYINHLRLF